MCILCVASRWSRRIVTMLPWLIFPLVLAWAVSQLLPPGFRFEVTSPRLACVGVLLLSLAWYELVMPRLSEWRARRSLLLHERRRIEAQEAAKMRKEAIRKCRNCFMAYKDQKPQVGGKFMCTFCGHLSKRPALHVPGLSHYLGVKEELNRKRALDKDVWPGVWMGVADNKCSAIGGRERESGLLIVFRLVSFLGCCVWWACSKLWTGGMMSDAERLRTERKAGHRKGEDSSGQESKVDRVRRKAEEKRLARLEKEQMEAEERLQREEVARLVDERRRQRADAHRDSEVSDEGRQVEHRKQEKNASAGDKPGNGNARCAVLAQDDSAKKSKERGKRDKKADESTAKAANAKPVGNVNVNVTTNGSAVKAVEKGSALKAAAAAAALVKPSVSPVTKPQLVKVKASVVRKQDKHMSAVSATNVTSKVSANEGVVSKPSAWNRISWAWGKGSGTRTSKTHESPSEGLGTAASKPSTDEVQVPPSQPLPKDDDVPVLTPTPVSTSPSTYEDKSGTPSADSSPFLSQSVYSSAFMPSVPASEAATEVDLASKSTWKMWEASNLELPRLTQSLVSDERCFHPALPPPTTESFLSSSAVGMAPSVPINNNLWSNYHAFESARRIWEDDLQSEATPPEFVDCITQEVMKDPVIAADGHSYERSAIEAWLRTHDTSPKTGEVLPSLDSSGGGVDKSLRPNHNLRGQIIEYRECMQRGLAAPATNVGWTEPLKKGHIGGLYTPPGLGSVWAFSTT